MATRKRLRDDYLPFCQWHGCASAAFSSSDELGMHVNTVHASQKGTCKWEDCKYEATCKSKLQLHLRIHTGERPHACTYEGCGATFARSDSLAKHKRIHTGERPHKCTFEGCDAKFIQSSHLATHSFTHTGERPYMCDFDGCDAKFIQSSHLATHSFTHTGERPYMCDFDGCNATFARSDSLTQHKRTHTGERPYKCDYDGCDAAFSVSGHLANHKRTHTGERPHKCTYDGCNAAFIQSTHLASHTLRIHIGPWCVICNDCWVPTEIDLCGRCNMHVKYGLKERRFFDYIYAYDERLAEVCFTLRDEAMGCGVRKRPDGLMELQTTGACLALNAAMETLLVEDDYRVKLIIECDEHQHGAYLPSCELSRLQTIQERDGDAIYVMRYNIDHPDGFSDEKLSAFCDRLLAILDGDFVRAIESPSLWEIEYFGYTEARRALLDAEFERQQELDL